MLILGDTPAPDAIAMRRLTAALLFALCLAALAACGNKGPLTRAGSTTADGPIPPGSTIAPPSASTR
jgi:predicted small lipoprotein YifL